jgi:membrane fusion protein, multidrug efflux system
MSEHVLEREAGLPQDTAKQARFSYKKAAFAALGVVALAGAAHFGYNWWTVGRFIESTDDSYVGGNVTPISPHVGGFIQEILVDDNQFVQAGQLLVRLDANDFHAALSHAAAVLQARTAAVGNLQAKQVLQQSIIAGAAADLTAKQARAVFAEQDAARYHSLAMTAAGSQQDSQKAVASDRAAKASVLASQAALAADQQQLSVLDAELEAAKAEVTQAGADLRTAQLNLGYTEIRSPISGYVGNRYAQIGAYVSTGTNLLSVVPAQGLWVDANFKEDQLAHMKPGDTATITADVLPGRVFQGHVVSLSPATGAVFSVIPPQNATGNFTKIVQRVPVRIALDGDGHTLGLLRAGLSTIASVDTKRNVVGDTQKVTQP